MRIPWATLVLTAAVLAVYVFSSGGLLYPDASLVAQNAAGASNPLALLFSMFFHIGARHLASNLLPLVAFAALLESAVPSRHALAVFFTSGLVAAVVFAVLNPASFLAGASGGIAGLMTAGALVRPKWGAALLVAVPVALTFVALPLLDWTTAASFSGMRQRASDLEAQASALQASGQAQAAASIRAEAEAVNATLVKQVQGRTAEAASSPDERVHLAGALVGVLYAVALLGWRVREGFEELALTLDALQARFQGP